MSIRYTADQLSRRYRQGSPGFARIAESLRGEGRVDEAIELCTEGLRLRPEQVTGHLVLGKCFQDAGRLEEARGQFEAALRIDSRCLSSMGLLAAIMEKLEWHDAAAGYYRSILHVEPWDEEIQALCREAAGRSGTGGFDGAAAYTGTPAAPARVEFSGIPATEDTFQTLELPSRQEEDGFFPPAPEPAQRDVADFLPASSPDTLFDTGNNSLEAALPADPPQAFPADTGRGDEPFSGEDVGNRLDALFGTSDISFDIESPSASALRAAGEETMFTPPPRPMGEETVFGAQRPMGEDTVFAPSRPMGEETMFAPPPRPVDEDTIFTPPIRPIGEDTVFSAPSVPAVPPEAGDHERVSGDDIEQRLDDLFNLADDSGLAEEMPASPAATTFSVPAAPKPMSAFSAPDAPVFPASSTPDPAPFPDATRFDEPVSDSAELFLAPESGSDTTYSPQDLVTGTDVEDKLEALFGEDTIAPPSPSQPAEPATGEFTTASKDWQEGVEAIPSPNSDFMSTESMLPAGRGETGITGADIEEGLDRLFQFDGAEAPTEAEKPKQPEESHFRFEESPSQPEERNPFPVDTDRTMLMPAIKAPSDWETGEEPPADDGDEISVVEPEELGDAYRETSGLELEAAGTLILSVDDMGTQDVEIMEGNEVSERLDQLFMEGDGNATTLQFPGLTPPDAAKTAAPGTAGDSLISGDDISDRLSSLFDDEPAMPKPAQPPPKSAEAAYETPDMTMELPAFRQPQAPASPGTPAGGDAPASPQGLAPLHDEEEGYPEEEDMPASAAGTNVATVTLAEIYFQQGLREQALQIYRQLLEREPGNDQVRARIGEIEASKPEGDERDPGTDPRRPRPGLKVPKRKK